MARNVLPLTFLGGREKAKRLVASSAVFHLLRIMAFVLIVLTLMHWCLRGFLIPFDHTFSDSSSPRPANVVWSQQILYAVDEHPRGASNGFSLMATKSKWGSSFRSSSCRSSLSNPKVLMMSASQASCGTPLGDNTILKSLKNKGDYARRQGMDTWFSLELFVDPAYHRLRNKILLIRHVLRTQPDYDWYIWIDSDAIITDMSYRIAWEDYAGYSLVMWGDGVSLDTHPDYSRSLNTGVVLMRNDRFSREFFDAMVELWDSHPNQTELFLKVRAVLAGMPGYLCDQASAIYLLLTQKERWLPRVYLEERFHINRYWKLSAYDMEKFEEDPVLWKGDGNSPPFVVHFCGCALCWKKLAGDFDECQRQHERAFNFADNQIIKDLGFRHRNLSSSEVIPIVNSNEESKTVR